MVSRLRNRIAVLRTITFFFTRILFQYVIHFFIIFIILVIIPHPPTIKHASIITQTFCFSKGYTAGYVCAACQLQRHRKEELNELRSEINMIENCSILLKKYKMAIWYVIFRWEPKSRNVYVVNTMPRWRMGHYCPKLYC